jgi:mono/diheme cytochrome c family protein
MNKNHDLRSIAITLLGVFLMPMTFNACSNSGAKSPLDFSKSNSTNNVLSGGADCNSSPSQNQAPAGVVSYNDHIKPLIFAKVCIECHGAVPGLPNWMDYNQAFAKKDSIRFRVSGKTMPPPNAKINSLTAAEIKLIQDWVDGGAIQSIASVGVAPGGGSVGCETTTTQPSGPGSGGSDGGPVVDLDPAPPANPTFIADLKPKLFKPVCGSCHGVLEDLPNWQNYNEAEKRADKIMDKVLEGEMPPPSSGIKLTDNQKELVRRWVNQGAPYQ